MEQLERIERWENNASRAKRLRIVMLAMRGYTAPAVAMSVGLSRRVCQQWVQRFNELGLDGLADRRGAEKRLPLTIEQQRRSANALTLGLLRKMLSVPGVV